jgi:hypothetical protein
VEKAEVVIVMTMVRIEYSWGLSEGGELEKLEGTITRIYESPNIPRGVLDSFDKEQINELEGNFGDAQMGHPVEIDHLIITTNKGVKTIKIFNRGISLLITDDEVMKRLHRFCGEVRRE